MGVQDAPLGRDHVDAAEDARVVGHVLAEHRADREIGARLGEGERGVERGLHLGRAARPVAGEMPVGVHGDRDPERDRLVAEPVAVQVIGEGIGAPRPARDLGAGEALRVVEQLRGVAADLVAPVAGVEPSQLALAHLAGRVLGAQVPEHAIGHAHVLLDDAPDRAAHRPGFVELDRRQAQPFLVDFGGITRVGAGHPASHVGLVPDHHREGLDLAVPEDRHEEEDIGDVHPALVGIVHGHHVAGPEIAGELGEHARHRVGDRAQVLGDGLGLRDHAAARVAEGGRVVHHVLDDLGARGADDGVGHLVDDRVERALHDGQRDGIDHASSPSVISRLSTASRWTAAPGGTTTVES